MSVLAVVLAYNLPQPQAWDKTPADERDMYKTHNILKKKMSASSNQVYINHLKFSWRSIIILIYLNIKYF